MCSAGCRDDITPHFADSQRVLEAAVDLSYRGGIPGTQLVALVLEQVLAVPVENQRCVVRASSVTYSPADHPVVHFRRSEESPLAEEANALPGSDRTIEEGSCDLLGGDHVRSLRHEHDKVVPLVQSSA
jgi:hypothetical protein